MCLWKHGREGMKGVQPNLGRDSTYAKILGVILNSPTVCLIRLCMSFYCAYITLGFFF